MAGYLGGGGGCADACQFAIFLTPILGKTQGGRREKELPAVRPGGEDLRYTFPQPASPNSSHGFGVFRNGVSSEGVAFASPGITMRSVLPLSEQAYLRSTARFIAGLKGRARAYAVSTIAAVVLV